ncbi:hypothetical protein ACHAW5_006799 [Stephanodiscus triporus]|uniref:Uncharacterized protein n=1 Tax=Stephanodiscus triporus TaxID=2934178 RepID=A0ABD3QXD5_9STRA
MKSFSILAASIALPLFVAADSSSRDAAEIMLGNDEGVLFAATSNPPGSDVCTYSPDRTCYRTGWPSCCGTSGGCDTNSDLSCDLDGSDVCTYSPDKTCYESGWPSCCGTSGGCNTNSDLSCDKSTGTSVCTYAPDRTCYKTGWPRCCRTSTGCHKNSNLSCDISTGFAGSLEGALDEQLGEFEANMYPGDTHYHDDDAFPPHVDGDDLRANFDRKHLRG